jgi:2-polyprenyl-3-methyl-5-hydroxy-6-metoxy-1,4-benzoquinol methylase
MPDEDPAGRWPGHTRETRRIWDNIAEWWDDRIGDGNDFQDELIEPASERLLALNPGEVVVDVGCGAGRFTRRMAALGARVVASDLSERFIARARQRTPDDADIEYHVIDATDAGALLALGEGRFDAAVATMCLMDMPDIDPLMGALAKLLKPGGRFVFSVMHPCFQPPGSAKFAEATEVEGEYTVTRGVRVSAYITPRAFKGIGILGQPESQYYFHRPLGVLLETAFRHGLVMDGIEEPMLAPPENDDGSLRWRNLRGIPPVLVARLRRL